MIEQGLLVPEQEQRMSIDWVCREFDEMTICADADDAYMVEGRPSQGPHAEGHVPQEMTGKLKVCLDGRPS
jgi:hypothetical protein